MLDTIYKFFKKSDKFLLLISLLCCIYGLILINSATASYQTNNFLVVQSFAIVLGVLAYFIISAIDVDHFGAFWKWLFVLNILLQLSLLVFGEGADSTGHNSWIRFGGLGIQPGEVGKILFIFTFSMHTAILRPKINRISSLIILLSHTGIITGTALLTSGDMGMALAYLVIAIVILFVGGLSFKWFLGGIVATIGTIPIIWNYVLKSYHKARILVIFDPSLNPDVAYHGAQSQMAIGSGGIYGNGYMEGSVTQFSGLPAKHTDFIFSVAGEEFGLIGCAIIIGLLSILMLRVFYSCFKAPTYFSMSICAGVGGMLLFQVVQNVLMCVGITPVIGLTLPFFSYGGTSIFVMYLALGIVSGISSREIPLHLSV